MINNNVVYLVRVEWSGEDYGNSILTITHSKERALELFQHELDHNFEACACPKEQAIIMTDMDDLPCASSPDDEFHQYYSLWVEKQTLDD